MSTSLDTDDTLKILNKLQSPQQLFTDLDALFKEYHDIKHEYSSNWRLKATYTKKLSCDGNSNLQEIHAYTAKMNQLQSSFNSLIHKMHRLKIIHLCTATTDVEKKGSLSKKHKQELEQKEQERVNSEKAENVKSRSIRCFGDLYGVKFRGDTASNYQRATNSASNESAIMQQKEQMAQYFHDDYFGQGELFESPFGTRPVLYCDWTASGKALKCIETYIQKEVLTLYANTHTSTSITGTQTSKFRNEARSIILESLKGDMEKDVVLFCGSGVTAAIYKLANALLTKSIERGYRPESTVVFISIYEHNSNIYIWKELGCRLVVIGEDEEHGGIDLYELEKQLRFYSSSPNKHKYNLLIGSFAAASNVSGILAPIDSATALLHRFGALAFWDYATAAPYCDINMSNAEFPMYSKDAVFVSPHKFLGGPGSPGILCCKKALFTNYVPVVPGGGTVFVAYGIDDSQWEYSQDIEEREEGGTPDIIGSVRCALTMMVKDYLSTHFIEQTEKRYLDMFYTQCSHIANLRLIGNTHCHRLPVISFLVRHCRTLHSSTTKYLHHNFIAALMNDLFGIQGRGGCACAGMYGVYALQMDAQQIDHVIRQMRDHKNELARPGYFRINLHYTLTLKELDFIIKAVKYVCEHGWKFLPLYDVTVETGNYAHRQSHQQTQLRSLLDVSFTNKMQWKHKHQRIEYDSLKENFHTFFQFADDVLCNLEQHLPKSDDIESSAQHQNLHDDQAWYWLPGELLPDVRAFCQTNKKQ